VAPYEFEVYEFLTNLTLSELKLASDEDKSDDEEDVAPLPVLSLWL
jgi:hypothetical protein